jgi:peptidase E
VRTIFTMGGGGFTADPSDPALDAFVLSLSPRPEPRILFLPTASGDATHQIARFHAAFGDRACITTVLSLFRPGPVSLRELLLEQDVVYVGGGSKRNMLAIWREHGIDRALRVAWERGIVLAGLSAGAMCWMQWGVTTSTGVPEPVEGLGLLPGSLSVHRDGEPRRLPVYVEAVRSGRIPGGWAVDDGVGLLWRGRRLERVVSARPGAGAERVELIDGELVRTPADADLLAGPAVRRVPDDVRELRAVRRLSRG